MENVCIELENIEISFLDRLVLNIPRLAIHQFDRIGIVGKNGAGKSTLLKFIAGQTTPDKGKVNRLIDFAYFDQLASEEKMKKAEKVTQASKRVSKKEAKAKANKMFMTKSKDTSQKGIQRAAKALEQRMEHLEVVEAPKVESIIRFRQPPLKMVQEIGCNEY